jgi:hypothetical protein
MLDKYNVAFKQLMSDFAREYAVLSSPRGVPDSNSPRQW